MYVFFVPVPIHKSSMCLFCMHFCDLKKNTKNNPNQRTHIELMILNIVGLFLFVCRVGFPYPRHSGFSDIFYFDAALFVHSSFHPLHICYTCYHLRLLIAWFLVQFLFFMLFHFGAFTMR